VLITPWYLREEADVLGFQATNPEVLSVRTSYFPARDTIRIKWALLFRRNTWTYTGKIASIVDLTGASVYFHLRNAPSLTTKALSLAYARATFNGVPLDLWGYEDIDISQDTSFAMRIPEAFVLRQLQRSDTSGRATGAIFRAKFPQRNGEIQDILFTPPHKRETPPALRMFSL
jgi:hypothetical protein